MLGEQASQMAVADTEPRCQILDGVWIRPGFGQQPQCPRHRRRSTAPRRCPRRRFWPAAQTGAETGLLRRGRRGVETHVPPLRRPRRTHGPTIDARGHDGGEEPAVEAGVTGEKRSVADARVEFHAGILTPPAFPIGHFRTCTAAGARPTGRLEGAPVDGCSAGRAQENEGQHGSPCWPCGTEKRSAPNSGYFFSSFFNSRRRSISRFTASLFSTLNSTRRFCARPMSVPLSAIGWLSP